MNYLAVDTSNDYLAVVLKADGKTYGRFLPDGKIRHSVNLMPTIEDLLSEADVAPKDIDVFCTVVGPGSFTGIRIGVATIKGFADALGKKVLGVTAFDLCSYNTNDEKKLCVIDAAHGNYYACGFTGEEISFAPSFIVEKELEALTFEYSLYSVKDIDGFAVKKIDVLKGLEHAADKFLSRASSEANSVKPLYLRLSQAEEGRK